jgi:hypothetical protein
VSRSSLKGGVAPAICCDHTGLYLGASALVLPRVTDPSILESIACREALSLVADLGLSRLYVASDCKQVVEDIANGSFGTYGSIIKEIKIRSDHFEEYKFVFEGRASNFEAHNLARHVLNLEGGRYIWLGLTYSLKIPVNNIIDQ